MMSEFKPWVEKAEDAENICMTFDKDKLVEVSISPEQYELAARCVNALKGNPEIVGELVEAVDILKELYSARKERPKAKSMRGIARRENPCENIRTLCGGYMQPNQDIPCFYEFDPLSPESECDSCKKVRPFHDAYMRAATRARVALDRAMKFGKKALAKLGGGEG
jgi:hypothetical protein